MLRPYTSAEVAEKIDVALDTFYRTRKIRHDRDGLPQPISARGPLKWERTGFDAWLTRHHPARPPRPANDASTTLAPGSDDEHRARLALAYAPVRDLLPLDTRRRSARG